MDDFRYCMDGHIFCKANKIMLAVDGSEGSSRAATVAFEIAEMTKSKIFIVHVIPTPVVRQFALMSESDPEEILIKYKSKGEKLLEGVRKASIEYGLETELILDRGSPSDRIISLSKEKGVDIVVIGAIGSSGGGRAGLGSSAERVVFGTDCPVLVVK
ncbi:MAG: universal stress protein [Candidatus Odinarchaeota archaeon]